MHSNCYFRACGENSDITVGFSDPDFLGVMGGRRIFSRGVQIHRRSQDFLWMVHFFPNKNRRLFSIVALKTQAKTTK